jgi:hypothetical protein
MVLVSMLVSMLVSVLLFHYYLCNILIEKLVLLSRLRHLPYFSSLVEKLIVLLPSLLRHLSSIGQNLVTECYLLE